MPEIVYDSILDHPLWDHWGLYCIWKWLRAGRSKYYGHWRIEVDSRIPPAFLRDLVAIRVKCPTCGDPIQPFRWRDEDETYKGVYFALACRPQGDKVRCSRKDAARTEAERIHQALLHLYRISS